ncbi:hypothetical protein [Beijerinckia sp. L45]|uniref:hypothetical protein n=1 Tax=Beijerinckia sp. L45 TaxID=1641855 RepID=UPI001FED522A|nr:hypothetical protein [Beijerinckia sp. L45]
MESGRSKLRPADRERSLQALMTTNLLKRLESSVEAFRLTLRALSGNIVRTLDTIASFERSGGSQTVGDYLADISLDDEADDFSIVVHASVRNSTRARKVLNRTSSNAVALAATSAAKYSPMAQGSRVK